MNLLEEITEKNVLCLSPHCDDLAFSMSGLFSELPKYAKSVKVKVVFSRSSHQFHDPERTDLVDKVTKFRQVEDVAYFEKVLSDIQNVAWLNYLDTPLRQNHSFREICNTRFLYSADLALISRLHGEILGDLSTVDIVFAPAAIGSHIDHRIVRNVALIAQQNYNFELFLYEDMPYTAKLNSPTKISEIMSLIAQFWSATIVANSYENPKLMDIKRSSMNHYPSQTNTEEIDCVVEYTQNRERFWQIIPTIQNDYSVIDFCPY